jgi:hypothetical protein
MFSFIEVVFFLSHFSLFFLLVLFGESSLGMALMLPILIWLWCFYKQMHCNKPIQRVWMILGLLIVGVSVTSLFFTQSIPLTLNKIVSIILGVLYFFVFLRSDPKKLSLEISLQGYYLLGIILSLFSLFFFAQPNVDLHLPAMNLLVTYFGHNHIASYLLFIFPFAWFLVLKNPAKKWYFGLFLVLIATLF